MVNLAKTEYNELRIANKISFLRNTQKTHEWIKTYLIKVSLFYPLEFFSLFGDVTKKKNVQCEGKGD